MNSIQFSELKFDSPISNHYKENDKMNMNSCNSLTTTEQNDKLYQNNMSITKFKYSNFDNNSSLKKNNEKNNSNNITSIDLELSPFIEKKIDDNSDEKSPISTLCNYYLQSDNNVVKCNKKNLNLKNDNNKNDCKKNIYSDLNNPINEVKSKNKEIEISNSKINNIIKIKMNELNNILYDKIKEKNWSLRKFTLKKDNSYNNSTTKFMNLKYKQNNCNKMKNKTHYIMNDNQEKNPFYNIIPKIINEKKKNIKLIPHSKINNKFNNNINNYNYKPKIIDKKSNYSFESPNQKNIYNTINNFTNTKQIFTKLERNKSKEDNNNNKFSSKIKEYSNNSFNNNNKNISFKNKILSSNMYKIINTSPNYSSSNSNYPTQNMKTISNDSIIKSPNKKLSFQSEKPLSRIKNYYYTKSKKNISSFDNYLTNNTSNYISYLTTNFSNKNNKRENTYDNIPSSLALNTENNKIKKIYSYHNNMNKEINEIEKVQTKKKEDILIKFKSYRSNYRNKNKNFFLFKLN